MAIKETVSESSFIDGFSGSYATNFSYEARKVLYDYLWDLSEDMGEDIEYDPVALCCEYTEYTSLEEFNNDYGEDCESIEDIWDFTQVIVIDEDKEWFIILSW